MPLPERGESYLKTIIFLAFVAALVFTALKVFPVYFSNYQLSDYIRDRLCRRRSTELRRRSSRQRSSITPAVWGLSSVKSNVRVTNDEGTVRIRVDHTVPVDLKITTWNLHFTPSAESRAL